MPIYWINQTENLVGEEMRLSRESYEGFNVQMSGTFGGAEINLEVRHPFIDPDNDDFVHEPYALDNFDGTEPGIQRVLVPENALYRFVLSGATDATSISISTLNGAL